ncbi:hypothetical protein Nepgr_023611 [Nepenthes gracilis]|uniref:RRM domain-containing protein n=1 Tax=Nepenthes gracilis TaxID=150966 RepID=A0AAD3T3D8_NEPGR|nr:hypothetical protein Nepgr_023611 [Nepenthes gracilis]
MSQQQRQSHMMGGGNHGVHFHDPTYTKIFVGGLAWETQSDAMKSYFQQFGEILEAVVITDKNTGRSKGYGFVTFKDPEAAFSACQNPSPVIDGRQANCNIAVLGAQKTKRPAPQQGQGRFRPPPGLVAQPAYPGSASTYYHQPSAQLAFPYSAYGYTSGNSNDPIYQMNYYGVYGGQQFPVYYTAGGSGGAVYVQNFYPYYTPYAQSSRFHGYGVQQQFPQMLQYPSHGPQLFSSSGILPLPTSMPLPSNSAGAVMEVGAAAGSGSAPSQTSGGATSEQNLSP